MELKRKARILKAGKSPSQEAMKRTLYRATANGGVTQDFSANVENIRELSRKLNFNVVKSPQPVARNLIKYSEDFTQSIWNKDRATITPNQIANPIDGFVNASLLTIDATNNTHRILYNPSGLTLTNSTVSVYLKKNTTNLIQLNASNSPQFINFDLNSGTVVNAGSGVVSSSVESLSNGWYRCKVTFNSITTSTISILFIQNASDTWRPGFLGNGTDSIYVWGVQLEQNTIATKYQPTQATPIDSDYTNANFLYVPSSYGESKNFTQNPSIRNLVKFSEDFVGGWGGANITEAGNVILAPNGTMTADMITSSIANSFQNQTVNVTPGVYTSSIYIKNNNAVTSRLRCVVATGNEGFATLNWSGSTLTSLSTTFGISHSFESLPDNWYRVVITFNILTSDTMGYRIYPDTILANTSVYLWGAQLEQSSTATTYQRTTDGISDFTFTRATTSTVTNKQGVIEDSCYNLIQRSEEFDNAAWSKLNTTIASNTTISPNNTLTGDLLTETTVNGIHQIACNPIVSVIGQSYTFTVYVKANTGIRNIGVSALNSTPAGGNGFYLYDLSSGLFVGIKDSVPPVSTSSISTLNNGWYLITVTSTATGVGVISPTVRFHSSTSNSFPGDITSSIYIWGAQLTQSSTSRPYLKTTDRLNVPCLSYDRSLLEPSLVIEPQRTNIRLQSENFLSGSWIKVNTVATINTTANPFGVNLSHYIEEDNTSNPHSIGNVTAGITSGTTYTSSYYIKKADVDWIQIANSSSGFGVNAWANFNLTTGNFGLIGSSTTVTKRQLTNGYWLLTLTAPATVTSTAGTGRIVGTNNTDFNGYAVDFVYLGTNKKLCDVAAIQVEAGSNATSYIPTTTATVTRNADNNWVDLWNNNLLNRVNFTLYWEGYMYNGSGTSMSFCLSDTTTAASNTNQVGWDDTLRPFYNIGGVRTNSGGGGAAVNNTFNRLAIQYNNGTVNYYVNGVNVFSSALLTVFDYRYLVLNSGGSTYSTDKIALFNRTLTSLECINLTNP